MKKNFTLFLKGMAMGAANVIPGVSGGTIAFITGIYERLIHGLKCFNLHALKLLLQGRWTAFARHIDLKFFIILFLGIVLSIFSLAKILGYIFEHHESLALAFFFGLIATSILIVIKQITAYGLKEYIAFLIGVALVICMFFLPLAQSNDNFLYVFICGLVAVCSMILPGISGSYILLLMGNYQLVLHAIKTLNVSVLMPLFLGCVFGLVTFSHLISYLLKKYKNTTISFLAGFVAASLSIIWPWKEPIYENEKIVSYKWLFPDINNQFFIAIALMVCGFFLVKIIENLYTYIYNKGNKK